MGKESSITLNQGHTKLVQQELPGLLPSEGPGPSSLDTNRIEKYFAAMQNSEEKEALVERFLLALEQELGSFNYTTDFENYEFALSLGRKDKIAITLPRKREIFERLKREAPAYRAVLNSIPASVETQPRLSEKLDTFIAAQDEIELQLQKYESAVIET